MKRRNNLITYLIIFILILQFFANVFQVSHIYAMAEKEEKLTTAESMITVEANSGRVLYSKDENKRLPMASTTKIITAIVAIENCKDLDTKYEIPKEAVGIEGSSIYLRKGEHLSIRELLYGLMLNSGNDSAVAIAILVGGSLDKFVKMMNKFCLNLELNNTNIVTVNGLHDDNHYTTASDLAKVTSYALKNETFAEIVATKDKTISGESVKGGYRYLKNKNKLLKMVDGADGVKTGYTLKAGRCFVGSATRNNMHIVCVVLNCVPMFEECSNLMEKAFKEYSMYKLISKGELSETQIKNGKKTQNIPVILKDDIYYPFTHEEMKKFTANLCINENLTLPLTENTEIGTLEIKLENNLIFSQKLYTINVENNREENFIKKLIEKF